MPAVLVPRLSVAPVRVTVRPTRPVARPVGLRSVHVPLSRRPETPLARAQRLMRDFFQPSAPHTHRVTLVRAFLDQLRRIPPPAGRTSRLLLYPGTSADAARLFAYLSRRGRAHAAPGYGAPLYLLHDGIRVGMRKGKVGGTPTIDVMVPGQKKNLKIKFVA